MPLSVMRKPFSILSILVLIFLVTSKDSVLPEDDFFEDDDFFDEPPDIGLGFGVYDCLAIALIFSRFPGLKNRNIP